MNRFTIALLIAFALLLVGVLAGIGFFMVLPFAAAVAVIGLVLWLLERKARHKDPVP